MVLDLDQRARWATQFDAALRDARAGVVTVAEGLAAVALAYSIQLSPRSYRGSLRGVGLRAPASAAICARHGLGHLPATRLPLAALVVGRAGEDAERHLAIADRWGARFVPEHQQTRALAADAVEARLLDVARAGLIPSPCFATIPDTVVPIRPAV